jgi:hypothetical protein
MLGIVWAAIVFLGIIANAAGLVVGIVALRQNPATNQRRFARIGIILNLPFVICGVCAAIEWGLLGIWVRR